MASGTVTYQASVGSANSNIYSGTGAKQFSASQIGSFPPTPYKVTSAALHYEVRVPGLNADSSGRSMQVYGICGSEALLGSVPVGTKGSQTGSLSTGTNYEGITAIKLDGGGYWACQLQGGSSLTIEVQWEDDKPDITDPPGEDKEVDVITGTIQAGNRTDEALRTEVTAVFEGVDISDEINRYLISLSYKDNEEDEADDLQLKLQDAKGNWLQKWLNASVQAAISSCEITLGGKTKGMKISVGIRVTSPTGLIRKMNCGSFTLDSIKASGPPSTVTLKATSLPYAAGVRTEERDKAWEDYTLSAIGAEIAGKAGLGFMYDAGANPFYKRIEQVKETDIAFLQGLCHDNSLSLKVSGQRLVIFEQAKYEALSPVTKISWMDGTYTKYDLSTVANDTTFAKCEVRYYNPDTKENIVGTATSDTFDAEDENNQTLVITDHKVSSIGEANTLAAKLLKLHNKFEREASFTLVGNPLLAAGLTVEISGFGMWDGKYLIKTCQHDVSGAYTTKIKMRAVKAYKSEKMAKEEAKSSSGSSGSSGKGSKKKDAETYWALQYASSVFSLPPDTPGSRVVASQSAGTEVTLLGSTSGAFTLVSAGGVRGYVATGNITKKER